MYKTSIKHKFKIGENVILQNHPYRGWSTFACVKDISVKVHKHSFEVFYQLDDGHTYPESDIVNVKEFNEKMKAERKGYDSYLNWLRNHDFTRHGLEE